MAVRVLMPKASDTMAEGKVLKWLKREGESVSSGDAVVEIETDKVDMEVEATGEGVLRKILVPAGQTVAVGQLLAVVGGPEEDISDTVASGTSVHAPGAQPAPVGVHSASARIAESVPKSPRGSERVLATPLARRIAREKGIDISQGSGR